MQGRITHIDPEGNDFIEISRDSITLEQMPAELVEEAIDEGYDFAVIGKTYCFY